MKSFSWNFQRSGYRSKTVSEPICNGNTRFYFFCFQLTHSHTMMHFDTLKIYSYEKHREKRRKLLVIMFSTLYGSYFSFQMCLKVLSAICFNLDQSRILLSGNGLNIIREGTGVKSYDILKENFPICYLV